MVVYARNNTQLKVAKNGKTTENCYAFFLFANFRTLNNSLSSISCAVRSLKRPIRSLHR